MSRALLDPAILDVLGQDIGPDHARDFARRFCSLLQVRVRRLSRAAAGGQAEELYVAALSLHSASAMVGAGALADAARTVARSAHGPDLAPARSASALVVALAQETAVALAEVLPAETGAGGAWGP